MKPLHELGAEECRFALTTGDPDQRWGHLRLGSGPGVVVKGRVIGGGAYPHQFCAEAVRPGSHFCPAHHARCYRGAGKDARSLEEMIYSIDQSQFRGRASYAEHTDPMDEELKRETA